MIEEYFAHQCFFNILHLIIPIGILFLFLSTIFVHDRVNLHHGYAQMHISYLHKTSFIIISLNPAMAFVVT